MNQIQEPAAAVELNAVIVAATAQEPRVLTIRGGAALPSGPLESDHRTLQMGVRSWVERQTHHPLGYIEQLYTFADRDRAQSSGARRVISISYLGLTREAPPVVPEPHWHSWYRYFPWEDWRTGTPALLRSGIASRLDAWARAGSNAATHRQRRRRVAVAFGLTGHRWNDELVLQRYELLYEARLVPEAGRQRALTQPLLGQPMLHDHRRILATGIARLRAKIKYRPVFFELMPASFTLLQLQRTVEALAGQRLHKQNFRRLIEQQGLVEETGDLATRTGGRPARLMRFRGEVRLERAVAGTKLPLARSA